MRPLLSLIGASSVVTATDDDVRRSDAVDPAVAARALAGQGLGAAQSYGALSPVPPATGDLGAVAQLPEVRRYTLPAGRGIVHIDQGAPLVVDGSSAALANLAAVGGLPPAAPIFYAGDLGTARIRQAAAAGGQIVVSDSDRRQYFLPQYTQQDVGPVLTTGETIGKDEADIGPFAAAGSDAQTVAVLRGARYLRAPHVYGLLSYPEQAPIAAFDGNPATTWVPFGEPPADRWIEIGLTGRRVVPYVDVLPLTGPHGSVRAIEIDGRSIRVHPGWNRVALGGRARTSLRIRLSDVVQPKVHGGPGGLSEVRIPGVSVSEVLRAPIVAGRALAGQDLSRSPLTYLFSRLTGDDPFRRDRYVQAPGQGNLADTQDPEAQIHRVVFAPAARDYSLDGWAQPAVDGSDAALDRLAGLAGPMAFTSSARFHDQAGYRASSAFDGDPGTAWVSLWLPGEAPDPWIAWSGPRALTVSHLRLQAPALAARRPTSVRLSWAGGATAPLPVAADGSVRLPAPGPRARVSLDGPRRGVCPGTDRAAADHASDRHRRGIGAGALPGARAAGRRAARALRGRGRIGGRPDRPLAGERHGGRARRRHPGPCGGLRSARRDAGRHPVRQRATGVVQRRPAAAALSGAQSGGVGGARRRGGAGAGDDRALLGRRRPGVRVEAVMAGPRRELRRRVAGDVRRPVARHAPGDRRLRERMDRPSRLSLGGVHLPAPAGGEHELPHLRGGERAAGAAAVVHPRPAPRRGRWRGRCRSRSRLGMRRAARLGPLPWGRAVTVAVALAIPLGFIFAWRAGLVMAVALAVLFHRGVTDRRLVGTAAFLAAVAVPIAYVISQPEDKNGYNFDYGVELIWAHWIGVAVVILFGLAGWLGARTVRRRAPDPDARRHLSARTASRPRRPGDAALAARRGTRRWRSGDRRPGSGTATGR